MLDHSCQTGQHPLSERGNDLYETPPEAVQALRKYVHLPQNIWEPACGPGSIVKTLREAGHWVCASDLVDYGCPDSKSGYDFLLVPSPPFPIDAIVTNPPYKFAQQFVTRALTLCPRVFMLLRLAFLESERRRTILDGGQLRAVYVFRNRLPMMHRHGWTGPRSTSAVPFAWFEWHREHVGKPLLHRISWEKA